MKNEYDSRQKPNIIYLATLGLGLGLSSMNISPYKSNGSKHFVKEETHLITFNPAYSMQSDDFMISSQNVLNQGIRLELDNSIKALFASDGNFLNFIIDVKEKIGNIRYYLKPADQYGDLYKKETKAFVKPGLLPLESSQLLPMAQSYPHKTTVLDLSLYCGERQVVRKYLILQRMKLENEYLEIREMIPVGKLLKTPKGFYIIQKKITMEATAYYPGPECTGVFCDGLTSTGKKAGYGVAAVDPRVISLGSRIFVEGYGTAEAADVGAAIKGNRIDLCFDTLQEAVNYGRKLIKVYVLE